MLLEKIITSPAVDEVNVVIEIPMNSPPIKYELDKDSGALFVDRFSQAAMFYPYNYGFIPHTLSNDGDPIDALVIANYPVIPGSIIRSRPVAVLLMEDESGSDEKIIAVPVSKLDSSFNALKDLIDINLIVQQRIAHFFAHYKDLEQGKWVKVAGFEGAAYAIRLINESIARASNQINSR